MFSKSLSKSCSDTRVKTFLLCDWPVKSGWFCYLVLRMSFRFSLTFNVPDWWLCHTNYYFNWNFVFWFRKYLFSSIRVSSPLSPNKTTSEINPSVWRRNIDGGPRELQYCNLKKGILVIWNNSSLPTSSTYKRVGDCSKMSK